MEKFEQRKKLCSKIEGSTRCVIMDNINVLGDTPEEIQQNAELFFSSGGKKIQFTNGLYIKINK